ncbi:acylneuraminate cytidylyltransferase [Candidatus Pacearchaeota archaeon]|nr:acylneuraminate cytidylyltransferase [Candidatus Pacearchaeota archaeon]
MVISKKIVAIIPARGGSKRIPKKNIKILAGKPLLAYTIEAALNSNLINKTFVSTDDKNIADIAIKYGADVIMRPDQLSKDDSSTEQAMIHAVEQIEKQGYEQIDYVVLLQPSSPLRGSGIIDNGINLMLEFDVDSVLSVCEIQSYYLSGYFSNDYYIREYDNRPFSQSMPKKYRENGALYITKKDLLLTNKNRINGTTKAIVMNELDSIDIDYEDDFNLVETIILNLKCGNVSSCENLKNTKLLITDVDGVMTDCGMYYSENGDELKKFNTRDGMAIQLLREYGIKTAIITKENTKIVEQRANKLKFDEVFQGIEDKMDVLESLKNKYGFDYSEIAYIGDDINDIPVLKIVGFSFCPNDAVDDVKKICTAIAKENGGNGVVREFYELMKLYNIEMC